MKAMEEHGEQLGSEIGQEGKAVAPEWDEEKIESIGKFAESVEISEQGLEIEDAATEKVEGLEQVAKSKDKGNTEEKQQAKEKLDSPLIQKMKAEGKNIGAAIGDSYHHALAFYDYSKDISQLSEFLSPEENCLLNQEKFQKFLDSPLGQLFAKAYKENTLYREQHFMQEVEYEKLFPEDGGDTVEKVILQGIIDAFIMEGDGIILVDYKTDRVKNGEELRNRYQKQIDLYSEALEQILGKKVKRRVLYSFSLGEEVDL